MTCNGWSLRSRVLLLLGAGLLALAAVAGLVFLVGGFMAWTPVHTGLCVVLPVVAALAVSAAVGARRYRYGAQAGAVASTAAVHA